MSDLSDVPKIRVHFADAYELHLIPDIGLKLTNTLVELREPHGNVNALLLTGLLRRSLKPQVLQRLDFIPYPTYEEGEDELSILGVGALWEKPESETELLSAQRR